MDISISRALLLQLCEQLTSDCTFRSWLRGDARRKALALSLQTLLDNHGLAEAAPDLVAATRRFWRKDTCVRVDDDARQWIDREGIWISGWLRARTGVTSFDIIDPSRLASAIAALPPRSREVFFLHSHEDLDYGRIATRLGISTREVQDALAGALFALDTMLHDVTGSPPEDDGKPIA